MDLRRNKPSYSVRTFDESGFEPTGDDAPGLEPAREGGPVMLGPTPELAPVPIDRD